MTFGFEPSSRTLGTRATNMAEDLRDLAEDLRARMDESDDPKLVYDQLNALRRTLYGIENEVRTVSETTIADAC